MNTKQMIEEAMPDIKQAVAEKLTKSIMDSITYETTEEIKKTVVKELVEELGPKVREVIEAQRAELIASVCAEVGAVATEAGKAIGETMRQRIAKTFSNQWEAERAVKAVLGHS